MRLTIRRPAKKYGGSGRFRRRAIRVRKRGRAKISTHGGGPTWITGTYDPQLDTLYWPTGNPAKEYNGDDRKGDNLYTDCLLALDPKTGKLKWYYQFTPHDLYDWDATEIPVLVDANFQGQPRKLVLHADRNGFFYVLDRTNGKLLLAKQFIKELTWASGIGADGRPILKPNQEPTAAGTRVCPSQDGATNFYSPSYIPSTGLFYFQTFEKCSIYTKGPDEWTSGKNYLGGVQRWCRALRNTFCARWISIPGTIKWELPETPATNGWGGTISTVTGLVFFGEESGEFAGRRCVDRESAVELLRESELEGFADGLYVRWEGISGCY